MPSEIADEIQSLYYRTDQLARRLERLDDSDSRHERRIDELVRMVEALERQVERLQ